MYNECKEKVTVFSALILTVFLSNTGLQILTIYLCLTFNVFSQLQSFKGAFTLNNMLSQQF